MAAAEAIWGGRLGCLFSKLGAGFKVRAPHNSGTLHSYTSCLPGQHLEGALAYFRLSITQAQVGSGLPGEEIRIPEMPLALRC